MRHYTPSSTSPDNVNPNPCIRPSPPFPAQSASLCLVTTPGEEMAEGLRWWLSPLRPLGVPVQV